MNLAWNVRPRVAKLGLLASALAATCGLSGWLTTGVAGADSCPNAAVRAQQKATHLPDCRAYEIVNPSTTDVSEVNRVSNISDDGTYVAYMSVVPGDAARGAATAATAVATRGSTGWTSVSSDPISQDAIFNQTATSMPRIFSPDFSKELLATNLPASPLDTNGGYDYYFLDVKSGAGTVIAPQGVSAAQLFGATPDLSYAVFKDAAFNLYRTDGTSLELLSIDPSGTPYASGAVGLGGAYRRGLGVGDNRVTAPWVERGGDHAVSDDARRFYFSLGGTSIMVRDLVAAPARTVPVTALQRTGDPPGAVASGTFISAIHDGSSAFFVSAEQLNDDATPGGGIYQFDLATQRATQITPDAGDPGGLNLAGAIASDDQSHLYFTSTSALDGAAQPGDTNAYVWTKAGGVRFIAAVGAGDLFSRVTPDGRYALILSSASIDGANNNGHEMLYRYDFTDNEVACVSCRPDGAASNGDADIDPQSPGFPAGPNSHSRAFTLDGRVAFTSTDTLVPEDQTSAQDVYFYDRGTVSLLTSGRGDNHSYVGEISDDGRNIFVITRSSLVGADKDPEEFDVYDVRVGGGFLEPPPAPDRCRGEDCQTPVPSAADKLVPSSSRVAPSGNVPSKATVKRLAMATLSPSQRATLARTGKITVTVTVTGGGKVTVRARGRVGGKSQRIGGGSDTVLKDGRATAKITVTLTSAARRELSRRHRLAVALEARLSGLSKAATRTITLTRAHR
jgi:hypothetical protein